MHPMRGLQPCQQMGKEHIDKQCLKHGEKYQNIVDEEHHQNFLNQERTGTSSTRKGLAISPNYQKKRKGGKLESVRIKIIYGDEDEVKAKLGCHTAYVERTNLTSRTMNGRLVRKTLSFSKELRFLKAASTLEGAFYNFTRPVKTLRVEVSNPSKQARWQQRTPAMAAGLTDHVWTVRELLKTALIPRSMNT